MMGVESPHHAVVRQRRYTAQDVRILQKVRIQRVVELSCRSLDRYIDIMGQADPQNRQEATHGYGKDIRLLGCGSTLPAQVRVSNERLKSLRANNRFSKVVFQRRYMAGFVKPSDP